MISAAGVLVVKNGKVLALRRSDGYLGLPCGKVNENETLEDCAYRECAEETGYSVSTILDTPFIGKVKVGQDIEVATYLCRLNHPDNYNYVSQEGVPDWVEPKELIQDSLFGSYNARCLSFFGVQV